MRTRDKTKKKQDEDQYDLMGRDQVKRLYKRTRWEEKRQDEPEKNE